MRLFDLRNNYNGNLFSFLKYSTRSRILSHSLIWFRRRRCRQQNTKYSICFAPKLPFQLDMIWMFPLPINICCESCAIKICKSHIIGQKLSSAQQRKRQQQKTGWIWCDGGGSWQCWFRWALAKFANFIGKSLFYCLLKCYVFVSIAWYWCLSADRAPLPILLASNFTVFSRWAKMNGVRSLHFVRSLRFVSCPYMPLVINKKSHR